MATEAAFVAAVVSHPLPPPRGMGRQGGSSPTILKGQESEQKESLLRLHPAWPHSTSHVRGLPHELNGEAAQQPGSLGSFYAFSQTFFIL